MHQKPTVSRGPASASLNTPIRTFLACRHGSASIVAAIAIVPVLVMAGVLIDYSRAHRTQASLQVAADAAALAGAIHKSLPEAERRKAAELAFAANFDEPNLKSAATITFAAKRTKVVASALVPATISKIFHPADLEVGAIAEAETSDGDPMCILTMETDEKEALFLNSHSGIKAPDCTVRVNSKNKEALRGNSDVELVSKSTCVTGNYTGTSGTYFSPKPETGCPVFPDPLAWLPAPPSATAGCTYNDTVVQNGETRTFAPGVYCTKLEINSSGKAIFQAGVHVIRNTEFKLNSFSEASGDGVMFYLQGEKGRLNFNSDSTVNFSAPTSGTYAGILFFQARDAVSDYHIFNSRGTGKLEGVIYFPNGDLHINSKSTVGVNSPWWALVVRKLVLNSESYLHVGVDYTKSSVPRPKGLTGDGPVRLTQ